MQLSIAEQNNRPPELKIVYFRYFWNYLTNRGRRRQFGFVASAFQFVVNYPCAIPLNMDIPTDLWGQIALEGASVYINDNTRFTTVRPLIEENLKKISAPRPLTHFLGKRGSHRVPLSTPLHANFGFSSPARGNSYRKPTSTHSNP